MKKHIALYPLVLSLLFLSLPSQTQAQSAPGNDFSGHSGSMEMDAAASTAYSLKPDQGSSVRIPLRYGQVYHFQNGWNNWQGGYLDVRGFAKDFDCQDNYLCVSTATSDDRELNSGSWKIISATGKKDGELVMSGDLVHLHNQWNGDGGYLDGRDSNCQDNYLCVSTAQSAKRDGGSGTWMILSNSGGAIQVSQEIRLMNMWNQFGGFLDVRGFAKDFECQGNYLCVSTSTGMNRDNGSTIWRTSR